MQRDESAQGRPNIVVFMTDQQHHETIGPESMCQTPHMDRFLERATRFTHAFTPTPICTPARASCQTGLIPHRHRLVHNTHKNFHIVDNLPDGVPTLADILSQCGYRTAYVGKWHVGKTKSPLDHGYQSFDPATLPSERRGYRVKSGVEIIPGDPRGLIAARTDASPEDTEPMAVAEAAVRQIAQLSESPEPFLLFVSTLAPHVPWICPEDYAQLHDPKEMEPWPSYNDPLSGRPDLYQRHFNKQNYCRMPNDWPSVAEALSCYYGMVTLCDEAFGRVLGALSECGRADNTLVAFTSDHGEMMGRHGLIGKDDVLLDDLVRIPLAISLPGQAEARECDDLVSLTDVFNTCLEAAGAAQPRRTDGQSLLSHSRGLGTEPAGEIFLEHHGSMFFNAIRGIRTREFKYVFNPHNFDELYDLRLDPLEMTNRVDDTSYSDILRDLRERLVDWMTRTEDQATQGAQYSLLEHP